jgi:hypothetical protein
MGIVSLMSRRSRRRTRQGAANQAAAPSPNMDPGLLRVFQLQVWIQARFAQFAYEELNRRIANLEADRARSEELAAQLPTDIPGEEYLAQTIATVAEPGLRAWAPTQAILSAVANIAKALWGQGGKLELQRVPLRQSLNVSTPSPLQDTLMRNNFDHFDDRLDTWWIESETHMYLDRVFRDTADFASAYGAPATKDFLRSYDPATGDLVFWGDKYHLPTIMAEIDRIADAALRAFTKTSPSLRRL